MIMICKPSRRSETGWSRGHKIGRGMCYGLALNIGGQQRLNMLEENNPPVARDAESEFRRRLAAKLQSKGYAGCELETKIDELLSKGVNLRLSVEEILAGP